MHASVRNYIRNYIEEFEGNVPYMYLDTKGLVTIGIGCLIDPVDSALDLPFQKRDGHQAATRAEIRQDWDAVKARTDLTHARGRLARFREITHLELPDTEIERLFQGRLTRFENILRENYFPDYDNWPADAQLALLDMAWGLGPYFPRKWPRFRAACQARDWNTAARQSHIRGARESRNRAHHDQLTNAAAVEAGQRDGIYQPTVLYYPILVFPPEVVRV